MEKKFITQMKYHIKTWAKRIFSYENLVNVLFWNTLIMCLLLPLIVVNLTLYYVKESVDLHGAFQEGIFLRRYQLIGILLFTCTDLILFMLVKFIKDYSPIFVGCSTDLKIKLFCGSRFIPLVMFLNLVKPIELLDINKNYTSPFSWLIRLVVFLLILVNFLPLLYAEFQFLYSVGKNTPKAIQFPTTQECPINKDDEKLSKELLKSYKWEQKAPAILFLSIKSCLLFFFILEVSIIDLRLNSPLSLDYPLIISTSNMLFVYFGHRSVRVKYNINETKKSIITMEYVCIDGKRCCSALKNRQLLSYNYTEDTKFQHVDLEYNLLTESQLSTWLKEKLLERIYTV